jgi:TolB protein
MRRFLIGLAFFCATEPLWPKPIRNDAPPSPGLLIVSKRTGNAEIFLVDAKGQGARNLTNNVSEDSYPAWSPSGRSIAFASDRDGATNIYVMDAEGKNVRQLTTGADRSRCPAWSPDGKKIAFGKALANGASCAGYVTDPDGGNLKHLGDDVWNPAWSPDGKKILFASKRDGNGFRIYDMDADGANVKQLTTNANPYGSVYPCYSPDGKRIMWTDGDDTALEIHVANADGTNIQKLTNLGGMNTFAIWSADGKAIIFHHMPDQKSGPVFIMDTDGGNRRELLKNEELVKGARPAWRMR